MMTYFVNTEKDAAKYPNSEYMAFFDTHVVKNVWEYGDGLQSFYGFAAPPNPKACVVVSPGRAESVIKYAEIIYELYQNGYVVFIIDHQGQGKSSRLLANRQVGYVETFDHYIEQMNDLISRVLVPKLKQLALPKALPMYLLCHSMGGAIGCAFVQKYPTVFTKLVLSAPMLGIKSPLPEFLVQILLTVLQFTRKCLGKKPNYFLGQGDYQANKFENNNLTNSKIRYNAFVQLMADYPENRLGGISYEWLQQAIICMQTIRQNMPSVSIPSLILMAEQDQIVDNNRIKDASVAQQNAKLIVVENAQHEILFEQDEARKFAWQNIFAFLESKLA